MKPTQEPIQVSDWSQKYKLAIYAISGAAISYFGYLILKELKKIAELLHYIAYGL